MAKVEIRQTCEESRIFTEILVDGHKLDGVRSYELKHEAGRIPVLSLDLNAFDISTDLMMLRLNQSSFGEIESIKFKDGCEVKFE